jgi:hypothetical protein
MLLNQVQGGSNPGLVMWDFVMDKSGAGAGFLRGTSVSPANLYSIFFRFKIKINRDKIV